MAGKSSSKTPEKGELEQMLRRLGPEIARIFRLHGVTEAEAKLALGKTLAGFARKWGHVVNRERWLLRNLEAAARAARRS